MAANSTPELGSFVKHYHHATMLTFFLSAIFADMILANPTSNPVKSVNLQAMNGSNHHLQNRRATIVKESSNFQNSDFRPSKMVAKMTTGAHGLRTENLNPEKSSAEAHFPGSYSSFNYDWLNFGYFNYLMNVTSGSGAIRTPANQRPKRKTRIPYQSVGFVRWTRNSMTANVPEPMKRIIFPRCPFFSCPDNHACDLSTNSCRLLLYPDPEYE